MNKQIFIIVFNGRDCDSGVWDTYTQYEQGFFYNRENAQKICDDLNKTSDFVYDEDADEIPSYEVVLLTNYENQGGK